MSECELSAIGKNKIAVVLLKSNDEDQRKELEESIYKLVIPKGFTLEPVFHVNSSHKSQACNEFMNRSTAKYKFYIDENVVLLQENLLKEVIQLYLIAHLSRKNSANVLLGIRQLYWNTQILKKITKKLNVSLGELLLPSMIFNGEKIYLEETTFVTCRNALNFLEKDTNVQSFHIKSLGFGISKKILT